MFFILIYPTVADLIGSFFESMTTKTSRFKSKGKTPHLTSGAKHDRSCLGK